MYRPDDLSLLTLCVALLLARPLALQAADIARSVPAPLPGNPGNIFLAGDEVSVTAPGGAVQWRAVDADAKPAGNGAITDAQKRIPLGKLGIGWYRIDFQDAAANPLRRTTAAVLARLSEPVPQNSPVCADSATAWFARRYKNEERRHQEILAGLAALAGLNWIRDRMAWHEVETERGVFAEDTIYDSSASLQAKHGLKVLQVFHSTPGWAVDKALDGRGAWNRFPRDLRHHYGFCRAMAQRLKGRVLAWEPWNEANIAPFGGHTIDEMCSMQKAAYHGLKAGDPDVTVCWNCYAGSGSSLHTEGVIANEAWPYFETYNVHSYGTPDRYFRQHTNARHAAGGRPIWITECGIRLKTTEGKPWGDLPPEEERQQAEFIAKSYASSLFAGVDRHFFFILGNYVEGEVQFGLLRHDQTPRPGYVALAAVGRFLAGAKCLGRASATLYAFRARPDARDQDVLVLWGEGATSALPEQVRIAAVYDHLGRHVGNQVPEALGSAAVFVLLPVGEAAKLKLEPPAERAAWRDGTPCPVVLQISLPHGTTRLGNQAHEIEPGKETELPLFAYNFGGQAASGGLTVEEAPSGWRVEVPAEAVRLEPMGRRPITARVTMPEGGRELMAGAWIKLRGDFGEAGRPVLAFRLAPDLTKLKPAEARPIPAGNDPAKWQDNIVKKGTMSRAAADPSGVLFEMQFADTDPWCYPRLPLDPESIPGNDFDGLTLTVQVLEGTGTVRVQFVEECGAAYVAEAGVDADIRTPQRVLVLFRHGKWGPFSKRDPDGKLQPGKIRTVLVGINSRRKSKVKMAVRDLEWVKF